jgi:hypothetical protein
MKQKLFIKQKPFKPDPAQLIQSGGEGMVFGLGDTAVKIYHQPQARHAAKLHHWLNNGLSLRLPAQVLAPCDLVTDSQQKAVGFVMNRLPVGAQALKQLANPGFWSKQAVTTAAVVALFQEIHRSLSQLHQLGVVVGDLNDHNLFFNSLAQTEPPVFAPYWIDVDSYQVGGFPCPVALESFLAPELYAVADFSRQPVFTPLTDWYAYFVLLVKCLLQVHPYGGVHRTSGVHRRHATLRTRAAARVSVLNTEVIYPQRARPLESLSDDLLHELHRVFDQGERQPFPLNLLTDYAAGLIHCRHCGLAYPRQRTGCPGCRQVTPAPVPSARPGGLRVKLLVQVDGAIVHLAVLPNGRVLVISRTGNSYNLIRAGASGPYEQQTLFHGRPGYRFGFFGDLYLAVNPPQSRQLLILDLSGTSPKQVSLVETALFQNEAVFAATPNYLYRIARGAVLKGSVTGANFLEEVVATARRDQTWLWPSRHSDSVAGFYRFFDAHHLFVLNADNTLYETVDSIAGPGTSVVEMEAQFSPTAVAFIAKLHRHGQPSQRVLLVNGRGQTIRTIDHASSDGSQYDTSSGKALIGATLLHTTDSGIVKENERGIHLLRETAGYVAQGDSLHYHPAGLIVQQESKVYLLIE